MDVCNDIKKVLSEIQSLKPPLVPHYILVRNAQEAWTGGDEDALRAYLSVPSEKHLAAITQTDPRPKETLRRLFHGNRRDFNPQRDNPKLAEVTDLNKLGSRNSSFAKFRQGVIDP